MIELERTFLVRKMPEITGQGTEVLDHYFPQTEEHPCLRLRKHGGKFFITKKQPLKALPIKTPESSGFTAVNSGSFRSEAETAETDASAQTEDTIELTEKEYSALSKAPAKKLRKIRHTIQLGQNTCELDIFQDGLKGLVLADFEFNSEKEKAAFKPPEFCLADVTQEKFLAGGMLAGKTFQDIEPFLKKRGYGKI